MITVNDRYFISVSTDCYEADYKRSDNMKVDKRTGKEVPDMVLIGYFRDLKGAVNGCREDAIKRDLKTYDCTLAEAVLTVQRITEDFKKALSVLDGKGEHI